MAQAIKHAVLFGATGLVGGHLLQQVLASERVERVTAVTRRPLPVQHAKLTNLVNDLAGEQAPPELAGADAAFSCLGTTLAQAGGKQGFYAVDHDLCLRCAKWARQQGVPHFFMVSAMGAGDYSPVYYNRVKAETERDLIALRFPRLTLMQPSLLLGERGGPARPGEAMAIKLAPLISPLMMGPLSPYTPVLARDVAAAMLARALRPSDAPVERLRWLDFMALIGKN